MKNLNNKAKKIYFQYLGDKFQMARDGFSQEYYKYQISKEQEEKWLMELMENELNKLNINDVNSFSNLWYILRNNYIEWIIKSVVDFVVKNENSAVTGFSFLVFLQKVISSIEWLIEREWREKLNESHLSFLKSQKQILDNIRKKY